MNNIVKYISLSLLISSFISCTFLQKMKGKTQKAPPIEGEGLQDLSMNTDVDLDQTGSDSGNIQGLKTVYFALDSSYLTEDVKDTLRFNKEWIDNHPEVQRVILEGHCDPLGSEAYNIGLGDRRARSVFDYLRSLGLDESKMSIVSYGEEKLFSETDNSLNRRVNFVPQY